TPPARGGPPRARGGRGGPVAATGGNKLATSRLLGISRATLYERMTNQAD
ncbi:helix-turn-helix domain-containing protein, partial [Variovorax sp. CT11-76]